MRRYIPGIHTCMAVLPCVHAGEPPMRISIKINVKCHKRVILEREYVLGQTLCRSRLHGTQMASPQYVSVYAGSDRKA